MARSGTKAPAILSRIAGLAWSLPSSICKTQENGDRQQHGADLWVVSAGSMDCYAITFIKRIGNNLEALAVHFHAHGRYETQVSNCCTSIGANSHCLRPFLPVSVVKSDLPVGVRSLFPDGLFLCGVVLFYARWHLHQFLKQRAVVNHRCSEIFGSGCVFPNAQCNRVR
jgi:hypothetical protein